MEVTVDIEARLAVECPQEIAQFEPEQVHRFARCFRLTWKAISDKYRCILIRHWRPLAKGPLIRLLGGWMERSDYAIADCRADGCQLNFQFDAMHCLPDNLVQVVVAHELGHALISAVRERGLPEDLLGFAIVPADGEERIVAKILGSWHFSQERLDGWLLENACLAWRWRRLASCTLGVPGTGQVSLEQIAERVLRASLEAGCVDSAKFVLSGGQLCKSH